MAQLGTYVGAESYRGDIDLSQWGGGSSTRTGSTTVGFQVKFIGESDLPEGVEWAATRRDDGACCLFVKRSACACGSIPAAAMRAARRLCYPSSSNPPAAVSA